MKYPGQPDRRRGSGRSFRACTREFATLHAGHYECVCTRVHASPATPRPRCRAHPMLVPSNNASSSRHRGPPRSSWSGISRAGTKTPSSSSKARMARGGWRWNSLPELTIFVSLLTRSRTLGAMTLSRSRVRRAGLKRFNAVSDRPGIGPSPMAAVPDRRRALFARVVGCGWGWREPAGSGARVSRGKAGHSPLNAAVGGD